MLHTPWKELTMERPVQPLDPQAVGVLGDVDDRVERADDEQRRRRRRSSSARPGSASVAMAVSMTMPTPPPARSGTGGWWRRRAARPSSAPSGKPGERGAEDGVAQAEVGLDLAGSAGRGWRTRRRW